MESSGKKYVYFFAKDKAEGRSHMKNLLGGKGANLAEMTHLGIPVPPGFTLTTEVCTAFYDNDKNYPTEVSPQLEHYLHEMEKIMGSTFGDAENPLLLSIRSGARQSMPGMMETILNVGLNETTIQGLIKKSNNPRFARDAYRRLIQMYSDVVMEKAAGIEPEEGKGVRNQLEGELHNMKKQKGYKADTDLTADDLKELVGIYKAKVKEVLGKEFPDDAMEQLWGGIDAVFQSWNGKRAIAYRNIENIPHEWGTAVNVQAMAFGNMGNSSATGVAFTRNPATGENVFYGEWLVNAQGEDVVAGTRTPNPMNEVGKSEHNQHLDSLETSMPELYKELDTIQKKLENHYRDMQDLEFTIQEGTLYLLQTRTGKRTANAAVRMAVEMTEAGSIDKGVAVTRVTPEQLNILLHPIVDPKAEEKAVRLAKGLPAGPGGASGQIVFTAQGAVDWADEGKNVILVREETNPEDVSGMRAAKAILTARGGMTSHAALVARGWGKCCIVGAGALDIDTVNKTMKVDGKTFGEGDLITLNGTKGYVYEGELPLMKAAEENIFFQKFLGLCDQVRTLGVRTNAETAVDAQKALSFGAEGIGLFRTEHMFYGEGSEQPLSKLRKMIVAKTEEERRTALAELYPFVKKDIKATFEVMGGRPVTIRLLDPPLHEFVPHEEKGQKALAEEVGVPLEEIKNRIDALRESNPMMGHRGVRLGITYPEIAETQIKAIFSAAADLLKAGKKVSPEIMIPVTCAASELKDQKVIIDHIYQEVLKESGLKEIPHLVGTMIEIPRACLTADKMAEESDFFSFGTNDLTQMGFGFSRDDVVGFLGEYVEKGIIAADPFQTVDQEGIGQLIQMAVDRGRATKPELKIGICGEQGGDPASVDFCHRAGLNYVSCSPFRVPIARLSAAHAAVLHGAYKPESQQGCCCCHNEEGEAEAEA